MIEVMGIPLSIINVSGWGAFALLVWILVHGFITGKIHPDRVVKEIREERDARVKAAEADRDARVAGADDAARKWQEAWQQSQEALIESVGQGSRMIEVSETVAHALSSLPRPQGGDHDG